jgi:hypothetical protein
VLEGAIGLVEEGPHPADDSDELAVPTQIPAGATLLDGDSQIALDPTELSSAEWLARRQLTALSRGCSSGSSVRIAEFRAMQRPSAPRQR